jgi:hypothetical protein
LADSLNITICIKEENGLERTHEPVSVSVPFPKGMVLNVSEISLTDKDGVEQPFAATLLAKWSDDSLKWVLFDFQSSMPAFSETQLSVARTATQKPVRETFGMLFEETESEIVIDTGKIRVDIDKQHFYPFKKLISGDLIVLDDQIKTVLTHTDGSILLPEIDHFCCETYNGMKTVIFCKGHFSKDQSESFVHFESRLTFFKNHSRINIEFTVWNPNAADHHDSFWDLGDPGSIFFKDLSICFELSCKGSVKTRWKTNPVAEVESKQDTPIRIYQDSSGGENWNSKNHLNHKGEIPLSFKGYRVYQSDRIIDEGDRATPIMAISDGENTISGTMIHFWQNFPSAIQSENNGLKISLFPDAFNDVFEIQGGEKKTHHLVLDVSDSGFCLNSLENAHYPLTGYTSPEWNCQSNVIPCLLFSNTITDLSPFRELYDLTAICIKGNNTFFDRREVIDEYGWRNFGEVYADHEDRLYTGQKPIISHYNNQYDLINSFLIKYLQTGDRSWMVLSSQLACHVMDIDIYHTDKDRYEFNHGLFWHTDHFATAATGTHRGFSKGAARAAQAEGNKDDPTASYANLGGGFSYEHVYSSGLLNYYYLTGDPRAQKAVLELSDYVSNGINGPETAKALLKDMAKLTLAWARLFFQKDHVEPYGFMNGPGRGSGNSLSVLLDGYTLSGRTEYLANAEQLIQSCVHPSDDLASRKLDNINLRWSYTIFLQSLGKYLDIKDEAGQHDHMFFYARQSLMRYAEWMHRNEVPVMTLVDSFDYPNFETRVANDLRKTNVLLVAAKYANENDAQKYYDRAMDFFRDSAESMMTFDTRELTRPLAIILQNINMPLFYIENQPGGRDIPMHEKYDFGDPVKEKSICYFSGKQLKLFKKLFGYGQ